MELSYRDDLGILVAVERVRDLCEADPEECDTIRNPFYQDIRGHADEYIACLKESILRHDAGSALFLRHAEALGFLCLCFGRDADEIQFPNGLTVRELLERAHSMERHAGAPLSRRSVLGRIPWRGLIVLAAAIAALLMVFYH